MQQQNQNQSQQQHDEEFRQTWGKMKPKISKQLPAPFNAINKTSKAKGKKGFQQFKQELEAQQTENFYLDKLDSAVTAEEYKQMQNLLQPLNLEPERKDKMERALTKIESYNSGAGGVPQPSVNQGSGNPAGNQSKIMKKGGGLANLDPLPQLDGLTKILANTSEKQLLSQSSGFSTYDTYTLKALQQKNAQDQAISSSQIRLDQMITLAVFKSTSGTVKKMLHAPSLRIFIIKEVPIATREMRQMLKDWIGKWEHNCQSEQFVKISTSFWNSPEGCVSVVTDYAGSGSLHNLVLSIGALPESILKQLSQQILRSLNFMHDRGITHNNLCCSQILFGRQGKVKIGPGFQHILRMKGDAQSSLYQNSHNTLSQLMCEGTENYRNRQNLLKDKFLTYNSLNQNTTVGQASSQGGDPNNKKESPYFIEMKKLDLFDLGVMLIIAATGGLDVISEESLNTLTNLSTSCCFLHAVQGAGAKSQYQAITVIRKILNRLTTQAQDFICKCLQQRFSQNEIKKDGKPAKLMTTHDMMTHPWILTENAGQHNSQQQSQQKFKVSIKELLSVSSDWKDVNKKQNAGSSYQTSGAGNGLPVDFQSQQIERIVEAIALTLPSGGGLNTQVGTMSSGTSSELSALAIRYDDKLFFVVDHYIKDLAYDLGVDPRSLKGKLATIFAASQVGGGLNGTESASVDKINNMHFNI